MYCCHTPVVNAHTGALALVPAVQNDLGVGAMHACHSELALVLGGVIIYEILDVGQTTAWQGRESAG